MTRRDHRLHLEEITANLSTNQKPFWRWIKRVRNNQSSISDIHQRGTVCSSAMEKAKALHEFFTPTFTQENALVSEMPQDTNRTSMKIEDVCFSEEEVHEALCKVNPFKSCGPDDIPGRLLLEGASSLANPLSKLFNLSMQQGAIPEEWLKSNSTPIFKKGLKNTPSNYR